MRLSSPSSINFYVGGVYVGLSVPFITAIIFEQRILFVGVYIFVLDRFFRVVN